MLVLPQGQHPFATERVPYWNDASLNGLWDDPRVPVPRVARPAPKPRPAAPPSNPPPSAPDDQPPPTPPRPAAPSPFAPAARPFAAKPVLDIKRMRAKPETPAPAPAARSETPAAPPRAVESVPKLPPFEEVFPDLKPSGKEAPGATPEPDPLESLEEEFARLVGGETGAREGITHEGRAVGGNPAPSRRVVSRAAIRASCCLLPQTRRGGASAVGQCPKRPALFVDQRAHGGGNRARGKAAPRRLDLRAVKRKKRRLFALKRRNRRIGAVGA